MAVPSLSSFVAGERLTAVKLNANTITALQWLMTSKPICVVYVPNNYSIAANANQIILPVTDLRIDTDTMYDSAVTNRVTIKTGGLYRCTGQIRFGPGTVDTYRVVQINRNGGVPIAGEVGFCTTTNSTTLNCTSAITRFNPGDYVNITASQSGTSAILTGGDQAGSFLSVEWVGA
ncbi:hypothetical protein ACQPZJ_35460 [Actinoplanes sp. CA-054009]